MKVLVSITIYRVFPGVFYSINGIVSSNTQCMCDTLDFLIYLNVTDVFQNIKIIPLCQI